MYSDISPSLIYLEVSLFKKFSQKAAKNREECSKLFKKRLKPYGINTKTFYHRLLLTKAKSFCQNIHCMFNLYPFLIK